MSIMSAAAALLLCAATLRATCPESDCFPGFGGGDDDCLVQWGGSVRSYRTVCEDGASCDGDHTANGVCLVDVVACVGAANSHVFCTGEPVTSAGVEPPDAPGARALEAALQEMIAQGGAVARCRSVPVSVPVMRARRGYVPVVLHVTARTSFPSISDVDDVPLYCTPAGGAPSFARDVAPILAARCGVATCHAPSTRAGGLDLSSAQSAFLSLVTKVRPDRVRRSSLLSTLRYRMPPGCRRMRRLPPPGGCPTRDERARIVAWILRGGPDN